MKEKIIGIYEIRNKINNKVYIGQSVDVHRRLKSHINSLNRNKDSKYLQRVWEKYGEKNFEFKIIEILDDKNKLNDREIFWIEYNKSTNRDFGYNLRDGGNYSTFCEETRKLMSISASNRPPISDKTREKLRCARKRRKFSIETCRKISENQKGKKLSKETKDKISNTLKGKVTWNIGRKHSEESKKKNRNAHLGKKHSEESKKKMSEAKKGKKFSEERKKNMKGFINQNHTEETKKRISETKRKDSYLTNELRKKISDDFDNGYRNKDIILKYNLKATTVSYLRRCWKNKNII